MSAVKHFIGSLDQIVGVSQVAKRVPSSTTQFVHGVGALPGDVDGSPVAAAVGLAAGYFVGRKYKHENLGALLGVSVGYNALSLFRPAERRSAVCNMAQMAAAVAGALLVPKHPAVAGAAAYVAAGAARYYLKLG